MKGSIMALWINFLQNNSFVNPMKLFLFCEKTGASAMVEPGLTAGWQAVRHMNLL